MTRKEIIDEMHKRGAHTAGEAARVCPELLKEYIEIVKKEDCQRA